ncbi:MAG TPA: IPT/TIG domain-containing protein [Verrucomicrobiae bacterium]|nr:IPT/TIG domain-containing protein [Verrucomicrobiae bacterium]
MLGQQLFPSNYPWNQNIANAPVATNSAAIIAHIGNSVHIHPDWGADNPVNGTDPLYGIPYNVVHGNSTAKISVIIDNYPGESDVVAAPIPTNAVIEGDYQNGPNPYGAGYDSDLQRGDSHLIVWDEDNNIGYEFFGMSRPGDTNLFPDTNGDELPHTDGKWHAAQESVWHFNTDAFRVLGDTSADAAGLSILAGLVRPDEGLTVAQGGQGVINHAFRFTLPAGDINPQYIYPGSHMVSETQRSTNLAMGARLRLKSTSAVNTLISNMPPESQIVARAMQQYGLVLADVGSSMYVTGVSGSVNATNGLALVWDQNDIFGSTGLKVLSASNFDVITLTPIVTGLSPTNGAPGSAITVNGQNFSGAAGNLSVFFGTTPASAVSVLSDSQISVTVPNGSGTVDVKVQSGTNEVDNNSDNPNANVTKPIFGYGTSAVTNADKFTFTVAVPLPAIQHITLSGANILLNGTNNSGSSGTYHVLTSTNLQLPRSNWAVLASGSFDSSGNFSSTNALGTNAQQFYILQVP